MTDPAPTASSSTRRPATGVLIALSGLMIVGSVLRAYRLGHQSLWNDEIVSWLSAQGSVWHVITQRVENSNIPPLYYLIADAALTLRGRLGLEEAIRLPSVVAGVLSIPLLFIVVRSWLGIRIGLIAAALMTASPFHVWYSQEARPYAVLLLAALIALACAQQALANPDRTGWKVAFAFATAATFYCHTVGVAFIGFSAVYIVAATPGSGTPWTAAWRARIRAQSAAHWRAWATTFAGVALLCVPGLYRLATFPPTNSADSDRPLSPVQFGYALWSFVVGFSFGPSLEDLHSHDRVAILMRAAWEVVPVGAALLVLYAFGVRWMARRQPRAFGFVGLWFLFPMVFASVGALITVHPFNVRYAVIAFLPALIVIAYGMDALPTAVLRGIAWVVVGGVSVVALVGYYDDPKYARDDYRGEAAFFTAHADSGDLVLGHRAFTARDLQFYAPTTAARIVGFPPNPVALDSTQLMAELAATVRGQRRVWLSLSRGTAEEYAPLMAFCESHFRRLYSYASSGVRLIGYTRDTASSPGAAVEAPSSMGHP